MSGAADRPDDAEPPRFDLSFDAPAGLAVQVSPLLRRLVAPNPGAMTFTGTCSYIVGRGRVAIVDPGPDDERHVAALLDAVRAETVTHLVVTHTHRDHSPAAARLKAATGARVVGCGPHRAIRPLATGESNPIEGSGDLAYAPDEAMEEGDAVEGPGWRLQAVETPGHTANHLCFALPEEGALLSGDHVMAWSTTVVGPPDGAMGAYMASLDKLRARTDALYWPGHGGPVREPQRFVRALIQHRRQREGAILRRVQAGDATIPAIVAEVYRGLDPHLAFAAGLSVLAHLEDLVERGLVRTEGAPSLTGAFRAAKGHPP